MRRLLFAANWKMHISPPAAREYFRAFLAAYAPRADREVWFFPPGVSIEAAATAVRDRADLLVGTQHLHWEPKGAFTGETSPLLAAEAGARAALVGHSERRHVFGETDADTARKVRATLQHGLTPVLCVGETLAERDGGATFAVVTRQLSGALDGLDRDGVARVVVAYEPVWAIGTGRNATPADAAQVHRHIRSTLAERGTTASRVLYGGSVNLKNSAELLAERELDGVLVGGASLDPAAWAQLVHTGTA